jgi:ferredoxin--NADP+ reductase
MERVRPIMEAVGQDVMAAKDFILAGLPKAKDPVSDTRFWFDFLASPTRILGDDDGRVCGLEVEDTTLLPKNGDTKARGLGTHRILDVDTVVFCIGDRVDDRFGLPIQWNEFVKHPNPKYPVMGLSYESYDPEKEQPIEGVFVAGWSREASSGLVGVARKDGENGARAVLEYIEGRPVLKDGSEVLARFAQSLKKIGTPVVSKEYIWKLIEIEQAEASRLELPDYKMKTNKEMLEVMGLG